MNALYIDQSETLLHNPADKTSIRVHVLEHTWKYSCRPL